MSWPFDISEPFITPEQVVLARERLGVTAEELALPPTLVAAFQRAAYQQQATASSAEMILRSRSTANRRGLLEPRTCQQAREPADFFARRGRLG